VDGAVSEHGVGPSGVGLPVSVPSSRRRSTTSFAAAPADGRPHPRRNNSRNRPGPGADRSVLSRSR
jgi:hypothetical protein